MTCRELAEFIADYETGGLNPERQASFEQHLRLCANCRRYLEQYRATVRLGRAAFDDLDAALPEGVPEDLIAAILAARKH